MFCSNLIFSLLSSLIKVSSEAYPPGKLGVTTLPTADLLEFDVSNTPDLL
jgi:hypothetical protein